MAGRANGTANGAARAAKELKEETFVLRATPSIKRYNIARFDVPEVPKFAACAQPVMMYREPEKVHEEDEEEKKEEEAGYNPALRKRRRRRRNTRTANWVIEDNESKNKFVGAFEGGQSSMYCLFVKNRHNDEFSVIPVEQWFRFKKPLSYRTLTLEEAEDLNNEKKRAVERWLMKHKMFNDEKTDSGDVVGGPRLRTGAVGGGGAKKAAGGDEDIFEVKESKPKRAAPRPKKVESEATGEDGGDFDEKFDDDESEAEIDNDDAKVIESDSEEEEIVEGDAAGKLNETGQAMKDLLKRAQNGDIDAANDKDAGDAEEGSDSEYSALDMEKVRRDLGGNIIRDRSGAPVMGSDDTANGAAEADKPAEGGAADAAKPASTSTPETATNGKRAREDPVPDPTPTKINKTVATRLTEAGVQQELMRYGGRMKSRDLLKRLKKLLVTDDDKAMLKDILRTICEVEKDAIEGNLFVLKSQFR